MDSRVTSGVRSQRKSPVPPSDPALPGLALLREPTRLREILSQRMEGLGRRSRLVESHVDIRRHWPGKRCTAELALLVERPGGLPQSKRVSAKCYSDDRGAAVFATLRELRARGLGAGRFVVPQPLAYDPAHRLLVIEWADGESLRYRLIASRDARKSVDDAAAWLRMLHGCGVTSGRRYSLDRHLHTLSGWADQLAQAFPEGERLLADLMAGIAQRSRVASADARGPTHRDFSPPHLVVAGTRLVGIDFDEFCQYDPLFDVAHFIAHLRFLGLTRYGTLDRFEGLASRFAAAYRANGRGDWAEDRRRLYEAIAYLKLGRFVGLVQRPPDWRLTLPMLLGEARRLVDP